MTKNIEWKAEIKIQWEDGIIEKIEEFDFSDDLISQIDYEIKDYKESKEIYKEERTNNDIQTD
jgi:hypothetical protein